MLENKKNVFWQALLLAVLIFGIGMIFGLYLEQQRIDNTNIIFFNSESSLFDTLALTSLLDNQDFSCREKLDAQVLFADSIFEEGKLLEKYDDSNELTSSFKALHKKYDLMRTILWINSIKVKEECAGVDSVIYFYEYGSETMALKVKQNVWSKVLVDLKNEKADKVLLIPIAVNMDIISLNYLLNIYGIDTFPSVLINEEHLIIDPITVEEMEKYLVN